MLVSGMSMEAFESSVRANVRKALGQRPGPSGVMPLHSSPLDVAHEPFPSPSNFRPVVVPSSWPVASGMIDIDMPGKKETSKCISRR